MAGGDVVIELNSMGITGLNMFAGSAIVIGGRLTDISYAAAPPHLHELVFAYSDVGATSPITGFTIPFPRLEITMIPEPSTALLVFMGSGWMLLCRRKKPIGPNQLTD